MFLTSADGDIFRVPEGQNSFLGTAADSAIRLSGTGIEAHHCELADDGNGNWFITNLSDRAIFVNEEPVQPGAVSIGDGTEIRVFAHRLTVWESSTSGPIAERFRRYLYDFEKNLQSAVLDRLRTSPTSENKEAERKQIEAELERQFLNTRIPKDLEFYLAARSLSGMLINRVHGLEVEGLPPAIAASTMALLVRIESLLRLRESGSTAEKAERLDTLMPWVLRSYPELIPESLREQLAFFLVRADLIDQMFGLGPLDALMKIADVNDIMVLPSGHIFIERNGMQDSGRRMLSPTTSLRIVERIVNEQGRRIDQSQPMCDARMKDGSRLNAVIDPLSIEGPALTIRRFPQRRRTLEDLVKSRTIPANVSEFLTACVKAKKNIVISGGTGTGKTTMLNALAARIPHEERIVTIEDTAEMRLLQTHVVRLQARVKNLEGEGEVRIRDLVHNALRMRPDRILVGECRGPETLDMLQAMNTGHSGSMTTIHANNPEGAVRRLETLCMEADSKLPSRAIREQIASAVNIIIQITRFRDSRKVVSIAEVAELDEETGALIVEEIFGFRKSGLTVDGKEIAGWLEFTGYVPLCLDELMKEGRASMECLIS